MVEYRSEYEGVSVKAELNTRLDAYMYLQILRKSLTTAPAMSLMTMTQFHWVHKDTQSTSLSSTNGPESREIRRFVQHQRLSHRKRGELQIRWSKQDQSLRTNNLTNGRLDVDKASVEKVPSGHVVERQHSRRAVSVERQVSNHITRKNQ